MAVINVMTVSYNPVLVVATRVCTRNFIGLITTADGCWPLLLLLLLLLLLMMMINVTRT